MFQALYFDLVFVNPNLSWVLYTDAQTLIDLVFVKSFIFYFEWSTRMEAKEALEMNGQEKRQKVQHHFKRSFLFHACPDEVVLIILSYLMIKDITSTRVWLSKKVQIIPRQL